MVFVIAEAGVNHNGDLATAKELVIAARTAKADAVKFQVFDPGKLEPPGPRRDMLSNLYLSKPEFMALKSFADDGSIEFMATPFDVESLEFIVKLGVKRIKIGSADLHNMPLLKAARGAGLPLILSTGMAKLEDIRTNIGDTLLHCTSAYPCPLQDANLRAIRTMRMSSTVPHCKIGLSDHTASIAIPAAAVALGAEVIEKHLTLDRSQDGPDHKCSLEPSAFYDMVTGIREVEAALGDGIKRPMPSEKAVMQIRDEREAWRCTTS